MRRDPWLQSLAIPGREIDDTLLLDITEIDLVATTSIVGDQVGDVVRALARYLSGDQYVGEP
jgi:hypothetical protein